MVNEGKQTENLDLVGEKTGVSEQAETQELVMDKAEAGDRTAELSEALAAAQAEIETYKDRLLRLSAEMENLRRRAAIDLESAHKFGLEKIASELLPVKDSLELGLAASTAENADISKVVEGMDLTLKMLGNMMAKFGIKEVDSLHRKFNPEHHQAMTAQESADVEPNTVINVFQTGYLLNERLLRPAMVVVSKAPSGGKDKGSTKIDEMA
jgi:molecular chaperone GrpE